MRDLISTSYRWALIFKLLMLLSFSLSCHTEYTTQDFSFPPGSKPHENNWKYAGRVIALSRKSPVTRKSIKKIKIRVYDENKTNFLNENLEFTCASVRTSVVWNKFEELVIEIREVGNKFADDDYNKKLLSKGPNVLAVLNYQYDHKQGRFVRAQPSK